jgi:hypothetical protein
MSLPNKPRFVITCVMPYLFSSQQDLNMSYGSMLSSVTLPGALSRALQEIQSQRPSDRLACASLTVR